MKLSWIDVYIQSCSVILCMRYDAVVKGILAIPARWLWVPRSEVTMDSGFKALKACEIDPSVSS